MKCDLVVDDAMSIATDVFRRLNSQRDPASPPMLIGAEARDLLHQVQGFDFHLIASSDVDVVVVCDEWDDYSTIVNGLTKTGHTGFRFLVGSTPVDILPFGALESPTGELTPPWRPEGFNVFGMRAVYAGALVADFAGSIAKLPTPAGFAALKLKAWIDRSAFHEFKDANDLALCLYWALEDQASVAALWDTRLEILESLDFDVDRGAAVILGERVRDTLGDEDARVLQHLLTSECLKQLTRWMSSSSVEVVRRIGDEARRLQLLDALVIALA